MSGPNTEKCVQGIFSVSSISWRQGTTRGSTEEMNLLVTSSCCLGSTMKGRSRRERTQILNKVVRSNDLHLPSYQFLQVP